MDGGSIPPSSTKSGIYQGKYRGWPRGGVWDRPDSPGGGRCSRSGAVPAGRAVWPGRCVDRCNVCGGRLGAGFAHCVLEQTDLPFDRRLAGRRCLPTQRRKGQAHLAGNERRARPVEPDLGERERLAEIQRAVAPLSASTARSSATCRSRATVTRRLDAADLDTATTRPLSALPEAGESAPPSR